MMKAGIYFYSRYLPVLLVIFLSYPLHLTGQGAWRLAEVQYGPVNEQGADQLYEWEVVVQRADAEGGALNLTVSPRSAPVCRRTYWMSWSFDKSVDMIRQGQTVGVSMFNRPSPLPEGCASEARGLNPGRLMLLGGHNSPLIAPVVQRDPSQANWPYVCLIPYPEPVVWGGPPTDQWQDVQVYNGSGSIRIGGRTAEEEQLAGSAKGGAFMFRIGDQGVHFQVVYRFVSVEMPRQARREIPNAPAEIAAPVIRETRRTEDAMYWLGIGVPDVLQNVRGRQVQLIVHFVDVEGQPLPACYGEEQYVDADGFAAVSSATLTSDQTQFYLEDLSVWIPYYALNLPYSGGRDTHQLFMFAEVLVDGKVVAVSPYAALRVNW